MAKPKLKNYTTIIPPNQTIGEIQEMLSGYGVSAMMTEYEGRQVSAVSFKINIQGKEMGFRLPCNWRSVLQVFNEQGIDRRYVEHKDKDIENQAIRTAWRIIHAWVDAQLALVEVNMVTIPQIFLPYTIMGDGRTLSEHVTENPQLLLGGSENK